MVWGLTTAWPTVTVVALGVYSVIVAIVVITDDREPTSTLAWILVLVAFPLVGLPFYYLFGRNWKKRMRTDPWLPRVAALAAPVMERVRSRYAIEPAGGASGGYADIVRLITRTEGVTPLPAYDVELMFEGATVFAALKRDLAAATATIDIQSYIWERDRLTRELTSILLERLAAGVEVRLLDDWVGSLSYRRDELDRLRTAGARIFSDVTDLRKLNYRDHRKIVVIDGTVGYTGGFNVGQEYIDGGQRYPAWRDTHIRFHGPAVADLQKLFAIRWNAKTGEDLFTERFFPQEYPQGGRSIPVQIVSTGVDQPWDPAPRAHMIGFSSARERIWIQSPYLVPTPDVGSTLTTAALSGLDVRFMMTGWPDKRIAYYAAESYFRQIMDAGVKVYRYKRGFLHAKTMTIDGRIAVVGTMNLDIRSLALDQELMAWLYDPALAAQHETQFLADVEECELITREVLDGWSAARRLRNASARLASNLL
jgi:cardiolipin synthase